MEHEKMELDMETIENIKIEGNNVGCRDTCPICHNSHKFAGMPCWIYLHDRPLCPWCAEGYVPGLLKIVDDINEYYCKNSKKLNALMVHSLFLFTVWCMDPDFNRDQGIEPKSVKKSIKKLKHILNCWNNAG